MAARICDVCNKQGSCPQTVEKCSGFERIPKPEVK